MTKFGSGSRFVLPLLLGAILLSACDTGATPTPNATAPAGGSSTTPIAAATATAPAVAGETPTAMAAVTPTVMAVRPQLPWPLKPEPWQPAEQGAR